MTAVFSHGRLRLYLLKLLDDGPKHGYELIRSLENRFLGLYAPSAGTVYPRLSRLESEGLVTHTAAGGRKTYEITDEGRAEVRERASELQALEAEISASISDLSSLAGQIHSEVQGSVRDLKRELREAAKQSRHTPPPSAQWSRPPGSGPADPGGMAPPFGMPSGIRIFFDAGADTGADIGADRGPAAPPRAEKRAQPAETPALERVLAVFVDEAESMIKEVRATEDQIREAGEVLDATLTRLRRLLRNA